MRTFYHSNNGVWVTMTDSFENVSLGYPEGTIEIPNKPSQDHIFDGNNWVLKSSDLLALEAGNHVRATRDNILYTEVDPIVSNPLRWADLTAEQQNAWKQYRTDLLDITDQAGFPHNVTWPTKP